MQENIRHYKLLVISDSAAYTAGGRVFAFEPVVRELEHLTTIFEEITWLASNAKAGTFPAAVVSNKKIKIIIMPSVRNKYLNALQVTLSYPVFLYHILRHLPSATHVHSRAPSHPALLSILLSCFDRTRVYWHKYAGSWTSQKLPLTYALQRWMLKTLKFSNFRVTVNGEWNDGPNIIAFENPCLTIEEEQVANQVAGRKDFRSDISLLFVGNLNESKGILNLVEALSSGTPHRISELYIAGDGPLRQTIEERIQAIKGVQVKLLGNISRSKLNMLYERCHILVLPSASEGFPKVIAEAAAYGCISVVTDISAISQYIAHGHNGFLLSDNSAESVKSLIAQVSTRTDLADMSCNAAKMSALFTYERYIENVKKHILPRLNA